MSDSKERNTASIAEKDQHQYDAYFNDGSSAYKKYDLSLFAPREPYKRSTDRRSAVSRNSSARKTGASSRSGSPRSVSPAGSRSSAGRTSSARGTSAAGARSIPASERIPGKSLSESRAMAGMHGSTHRRNDYAVTPKIELYSKKTVARFVAIFSVVAITICLLVIGRVEKYELSQATSAATDDLTEKQQEYEALCIEFDTRMNDKAVEEYAENVLGMQKREISQTEWITLGSGDVFDVSGSRSIWSPQKNEDYMSYGD